MAISKITENGLTITDLTVADDLTVTDDLLLASDGAILKFGADADVTLTHVHNTGLTLNDALTTNDNITISEANPELFLASTGDGGECSIGFKDDDGNVDGKIAYRTDYSGQTDNYMTFNTSGSNERMRINSNGSVSIGNTTTTGDLNISPVVGSYTTIQMTTSGTNTGNIIYFGDSGDADYSSITSFGSGAGETGRMRFIVGTTEALNIYNNGAIATDANSASGTCAIIDNLATSNPFGVAIRTPNAALDNNSTYFLSCNDSGKQACVIFSDGDIKNDDGVYGAFSDERIKQDIVDANSQWDDIKALKVRNFKKKHDVAVYGDKAWTQIGVIAQELEKTSPKLVKSSDPSSFDVKTSSEFGTLYEKDDEIPEGKEVGDVKEIKDQVKSVSYSVLYMKAVKALQEAMTRIETLEAKVKTLEEA